MSVASVFGAVAALRDLPLPDQDVARRLKAGFRAHALDLSASEGAEPLIDVRDHGVAARNLYAHDRNAPYYATSPGAIEAVLVREGVARRLAAINERLADTGLELFVTDGWRPNAVQTYFHDVWTPEQVRTGDPSLSNEEVMAVVETYWSAPTEDPASPAPHITGGAVDLTLRWRDGAELWMGCLIDDPRPVAYPDAFETVTDPMALSDLEARDNRRLLHWLMVEAGFAANPHEWWHFSLGDQMWGRLTGRDAAFYGATEPASVA